MGLERNMGHGTWTKHLTKEMKYDEYLGLE